MRVIISLLGTGFVVFVLMLFLCAVVYDYSASAHRTLGQRFAQCFHDLGSWWPWR